MRLNKPKFWDKKPGFFSVFLLPFSLIFQFILFLKKKYTKQQSFKIPVICVGNIYLGGTGKTPSSILIANELSKLGRKPAIIKKFYKNHFDEHNLINKYFKDLILPNKRSEGIINATSRGFDIVILDDGFQDYSIKKDLNIICFNQKQLLGNELIFPAGPLRQKINSLRDAQIVIINGKKNVPFEDKILKINNNIEFYYSRFKPLNIDHFKNKKLFAIAGIGNPNNFFDLLSEQGCIIEKKLSFPDHYKFNKSEILNMIDYSLKNKLQIVMTEKDYFKVKSFNFDKIDYLKIELEIENSSKLFEKIIKLYA